MTYHDKHASEPDKNRKHALTHDFSRSTSQSLSYSRFEEILVIRIDETVNLIFLHRIVPIADRYIHRRLGIGFSSNLQCIGEMDS
jgi:hypothetical protein